MKLEHKNLVLWWYNRAQKEWESEEGSEEELLRWNEKQTHRFQNLLLFPNERREEKGEKTLSHFSVSNKKSKIKMKEIERKCNWKQEIGEKGLNEKSNNLNLLPSLPIQLFFILRIFPQKIQSLSRRRKIGRRWKKNPYLFRIWGILSEDFKDMLLKSKEYKVKRERERRVSGGWKILGVDLG